MVYPCPHIDNDRKASLWRALCSGQITSFSVLIFSSCLSIYRYFNSPIVLQLCKQADLSDEAPSMDKAKHRMHGDRFKISKRSPLLDIIIKNPNHLY